MSGSLQVRFVENDGIVWEGEALSVLVRSTEGDLGVLPGHSALMALLEPHAAEVVDIHGDRHVMAVDWGFISVLEDRVIVLSAYCEPAADISLDAARKELAELKGRVDHAQVTEQELRRYRRLRSQVKAAERFQKLPS